jgi:hypothetical protein
MLENTLSSGGGGISAEVIFLGEKYEKGYEKKGVKFYSKK